MEWPHIYGSSRGQAHNKLEQANCSQQKNIMKQNQQNTLKGILNDPANKAAERVANDITSGRYVDQIDAQNASECIALRDGKKRKTYAKENLLKMAVKYKHLQGYLALLDGGHAALVEIGSTGETHRNNKDVLKSVFRKVIDPFQNWVSGHRLVGVNEDEQNPKGYDKASLPEEWIELTEARIPGWMQGIVDGIGCPYRGHRGADGMEQLKRLGVKFSYQHTNTLAHYLTGCSIKDSELAEEYGPCLKWLLNEGHIPTEDQFPRADPWDAKFFTAEFRYDKTEVGHAHTNAKTAGVLEEIRHLEAGDYRSWSAGEFDRKRAADMGHFCK